MESAGEKKTWKTPKHMEDDDDDDDDAHFTVHDEIQSPLNNFFFFVKIK